MPAPKSNLTCVTADSAETGEAAFWVSDPEPMDEGDGDWGFAVYADKDVFLATFTYPSESTARRARDAICPVLRDAIFIATSES